MYFHSRCILRVGYFIKESINESDGFLHQFQGQKSWKHDFEITGDPKFPPGGSTFWSGFEAPVGQRPLSGPKKSKITNKAQNRDFSIPIDR